jgi:hypothetical protein
MCVCVRVCRTATADTFAGAELSVVCIVLRRGHQYGIVDVWRDNQVLIFYTIIYYHYAECTDEL